MYLQRRHNAIQNVVVEAIRVGTPSAEADVELLVNRTPRTFFSAERVDLPLLNNHWRTATLIDIKPSFESGSVAFATARQRNELKYEALAECYRRLGFDVTLDTICIGARGTRDSANSRPLKALGIHRGGANTFRNTCCRAVHHLSRNI